MTTAVAPSDLLEFGDGLPALIDHMTARQRRVGKGPEIRGLARIACFQIVAHRSLEASETKVEG